MIGRLNGMVVHSGAALAAAAILWTAGTGPAEAQTNLTYKNWAEGFFTQSCCACHHSSQREPYRFGAPRGVNFDTLEDIRRNEALIRDAVLGPDPYMPPLGTLWPWDLTNLQEWMDAGMPGGEEALVPVPVDTNRKSVAYQTSWFYFSQPLDDWNVEGEDRDFNLRYLETKKVSNKDTIVPNNRRIYIRRRDDGTVMMVRQRWTIEGEGTRNFDYSPGIPILLNGGALNAPDWFSTVQVRERFWSRETWRTPDYENLFSEQWLVSVKGMETLDNGVMPPFNALKVLQSNLNTAVDTSWWFAKGYGVVRRETDEPSSEFDRTKTVEYTLFRPNEPLREPPFIRSASMEYIPFVGPDYNAAQNRTESWRQDYEYQVDFQKIELVDAAQTEEPTATPVPLPPDPTATRVSPTPTFTPIGLGNPPGGGGGTGNYSINDPRISNLMVDDKIDQNDLLIFLKHWHKTIQ